MNPVSSMPLLSWVMGAIYFCFFGSCILCEVYKKITASHNEKLVVFISILLIVLYISIYYVGGKEMIGDSREYGITYIFFIVFPIIMLVTCGRVLSRILSTKIVENLGKISFSIYLWNFPIYFGIYIILNLLGMQNSIESIWTWVVTVVISLIISSFSYYIFEKKLTKYLLRRL